MKKKSSQMKKRSSITNNNVHIQQQIAQLNIFMSDRKIPGNINGYYSLVFHRELDGISRLKDFGEGDYRVLLHIISHVDKDNRITVNANEICNALPVSLTTVYRAIHKLIKMRLICKSQTDDKRVYELTNKLINPRLTLYGNSLRFIKSVAPTLLLPDGETPLLPPDNQACSQDLFLDNNVNNNDINHE